MTKPNTESDKSIDKIDEILEELHNSWLEDDYEYDDPCGLHAKDQLYSLLMDVIGELGNKPMPRIGRSGKYVKSPQSFQDGFAEAQVEIRQTLNKLFNKEETK